VGADAVFVGSSEHNLDAKGRLVLPAKFRDALEGRGYLTFSTDQVLQLWPFAEFQRQMRAMSPQQNSTTEQQRLFRLMSAYSFEVEIEPSQGRIAIPAKLREVASLKSGQPVLISGAYTCVELWNPKDFERRILLIDEAQGGPAA
jgi:MraZ protein